MHRLWGAAILTSTSLFAQGRSEVPVRVSIAHMLDAADASGPLGLWPPGGVAPLQLIGTAKFDRTDARLLDLVGALGSRRLGADKGLSVSRDGTDLIVEADGVGPDVLRSLVLDAIDVYAPLVQIRVALHRAGPGPAPVVVPGAELERHLAGDPLYECRMERAAGRVVSVELGLGGESLTLRVQPHLLAGSASIALLCEFTFDRRGRDGARRWTAGTASGVVPNGGALVLTFPDRVVVVDARHVARPPDGLAGVPWSLQTSSALRREPDPGDGSEPLSFPRSRVGWAVQEDVLLARISESVAPGWWNGRIFGDATSQCLLVGGSAEDLDQALPLVQAAAAELEHRWLGTEQLDLLLPVEPDPGVPGALRLPTLPDRIVCVLDAAWSAAGDPPRGVLVALKAEAAPGEDSLTASGFVRHLRGADFRAVGGEAATSFRGVELEQHGVTELTRSVGATIEIVRARR